MHTRIVRSGDVSGIRGRLREGMSCTSPEGQRMIGLGRCGLEGVPIQGRRRGGPATNREGSHLRKNAISLGVKEEWEWSGGKQVGRFGTGVRKESCTQLEDEDNEGRKKVWGLGKGTLALGASIRVMAGTRGAST